jgi:hypothetical protein
VLHVWELLEVEPSSIELVAILAPLATRTVVKLEKCKANLGLGHSNSLNRAHTKERINGNVKHSTYEEEEGASPDADRMGWTPRLYSLECLVGSLYCRQATIRSVAGVENSLPSTHY